jgi:hypothetical protein
VTVIGATVPSGGGTDHHCGWYVILIGATVTIVENKQMVCFGGMILDGTLNIDGQLILEI